ncbi:hypothetical protein ACFE04_015416 [Oxalis oulophora]
MAEPKTTDDDVDQQKKRKRKDIPKVDDDGSKKNKQAKPGKAAVEKSVPQPEKNSFGPSTNVAVSRENLENHRSQNQLNAGDSTKKKAAVSKTADRSSSLKISNGGASVSLPDPNVIEKPKAEVLASKNVTNKSKDGSSNISHQKFHKKSVLPSKFQHAKATSNIDEGQMKQNNDIQKLPNSKSSMQTIKPSHLPKKDGSSGRPKVSFLEKAIVELKEVVVERTPMTENPDADNTSPLATKRRMPREVKLKLAKVARAEHAISGKITEELVRRLNGILGHFIQLRSLKRNLKAMVSAGLHVKQEKDRMFQQIKLEVVELVRNSARSLELKAGAPAQEMDQDQKGAPKRKFSMDAVVEDKICDLYDIYVDGLEEDSGPQIRKLHAELAELWPKGFMDHHGIKRAICRAKERRKVLYSRHKDGSGPKTLEMLLGFSTFGGKLRKMIWRNFLQIAFGMSQDGKLDQDKIKSKKIRAEAAKIEPVKIEPVLASHSQHVREKTADGSSGRSITSSSKPVSNQTTAARGPSPSMSGPNMDRPKQEKLKRSSTLSRNEVKMIDRAVLKKKVKREPEQELDETRFRSGKLPSRPGEEGRKSQKKSTVQQQKGNSHPSGLPSSNGPS